MSFDVRSFQRSYPFDSHWLTVRDTLRYHYLDEGAGEPLVCVHGNPTWSYFFRGVVETLRATHRVVVPDHIGCGLSDKPPARDYHYTLQNRVEDLEALLDELALDQITLVVHDWGGMIGLAAALRKPERIARLVVMNTAAFLPKLKRLPWQLKLVRNIPVVSPMLVRGFNAMARGTAYVGAQYGLSSEVRSAYLAPYDSWRNRIATHQFVRDIPLKPRDASYPLARWVDENLHVLRDRPTLICWGMHDFVFDREILAEWRRRMPQAEVRMYPDAGHYLLEDAGDDVVQQIRGFIERASLVRPPAPETDLAKAARLAERVS